jgi:fructose-specific PTS system IIA-like component
MQSLTFTDIIARNPGHIGNIESEKARFLAGLDSLRVEQEAALGKTRVLNTTLLRHIYL